METQDLLDHNLEDKNEHVKLENTHFIWKLFGWCLGLAIWPKINEDTVRRYTNGKNIQRRKSPLHTSSVCFLLVMILSAVFTLVWYVGCLFHNWKEFLRFTSYVVFYWPVIVSAQLICITANIKNLSNNNTNPFKDITWSNIFNQAYFRKNINILHVDRILRTKRERIALLTFYGSALICCVLEVRYVFKHENGCLHWTEVICTISNVASLFFYSTFCYFMYLNRRALQIEGCNILNYIQSNVKQESDCLATVGKYFKRHVELRKILFPWINMITFSTTFGVTAFVTWDQNPSNSSNVVVSSDENNGIFRSWFDHSGICQVTCGNSSDHNDGTANMERFIVMVICEKITVVTLALMAVGAMDVRYIWEDFQIKFNLVVCTSEVQNLKDLRKFVKNLLVHSASSNLATFVFPLFGIVCGILSEKHFSMEN